MFLKKHAYLLVLQKHAFHKRSYKKCTFLHKQGVTMGITKNARSSNITQAYVFFKKHVLLKKRAYLWVLKKHAFLQNDACQWVLIKHVFFFK
eukprot:GEMP01165022.1.p1 GENE.GEMP01165022.1~~GEMP01165022.1.p1  ORF type:complete len:106 (-),score=4.82 GEMP01165022.1:24-299(-)